MLPGAISYKLYIIWCGKQSKYGYSSFIDIFIISTVSYLLYDVYQFVYSLFTDQTLANEFTLSLLLSETVPIDFWTIIAASIIGILMAAILSWSYKNNILTTIGRKLKLSDAISSEPTWIDFIKNNGNWLYVKDAKTNRTYVGSVELYSDSSLCEYKELCLKNVSVYENQKKIYDAYRIFIIRKSDDLTIEVNPRSDNILKDTTLPHQTNERRFNMSIKLKSKPTPTPNDGFAGPTPTGPKPTTPPPGKNN